jgi:hypothetical protein
LIERLTLGPTSMVEFDNTRQDPIDDWPKEPDVKIGYFTIPPKESDVEN